MYPSAGRSSNMNASSSSSPSTQPHNFWDELNYFEEFPDLSPTTSGVPEASFSSSPPLDAPAFSSTEHRLHSSLQHSGTVLPTDVRVSNGVGGGSGVMMTGQGLVVQPKQEVDDVNENVGAGREGEEKKESEETLLKRKKAAVAAASRATRAKKKREMEALRERNVELLRERQEFKKIVANLQLKAQANREAGEIDLETENKLLRAELQEHKTFIAQFKRLADGIPVSTTAKNVATLKGAKAAVGQVLGLLNTSTVDPSWKQGLSRLHPELLIHYQRLPQGSPSKKATRINIRVDAPPISASMSALQKIQWQVWSDSDLSSRLSSHFGQVCEKQIKEIDLDLDNIECEPDSQVKVYYYREKRVRKQQGEVASGANETTDNVDTIFLTTSKKQNLPYNAMPIKRTGSEATSDANGNKGNPKLYPTVVMATTSTQHTEDIVSSSPGVHRIESALLEGLVIRELDNGTILCTVVNSYPLNPVDSYSTSDFLSATSSEGWIDDEGYLTKASEQAGNDFMRIFAESLGPEAAKAYVLESIKAAQAVAAAKQTAG